MTTVTVNEFTYYYRLQGSGPPLILLHGFTGSSDNWLNLLEHFSDQYSVLMLDLPGHGRSASPPDPARYAMEAVAKDLLDIVKTLNLRDANLLGYSMGGRLALYFACQYPTCLKSLILESASPGLETSDQRQQRIESDNRLANEIEAAGVSKFVQDWQQLPLFASQRNLGPRERECLYQLRLNNSAAGLANSLRGMGTGQQPSLWANLSSIPIPVLILAGELDQKFAEIAVQMAKAIPNAKLELIAGAGHNIHLERPKRFSTRVLDFVTNLK